MTRTLELHAIKPACPLACIQDILPAKPYKAVQRHLQGQHIYHPTVRHLVALYQQHGLTGIPGLGLQGIEITTTFLELTGLIPARATPNDSVYQANY